MRGGGKPSKPAIPGLGPRRAALAWALVVALAVLSTYGPALLDLGLGIVVGLVVLVTLYAWAVRRIIFGGRPISRRNRASYWIGGALLVVGGAHAPDAFLALAGDQGRATIAYASTETGSHGTRYKQCWVELPGGSPGPDRAPRPTARSTWSCTHRAAWSARSSRPAVG
ncbi:hypothetical protein ACFXPM_17325 [Streptomyces sp. NPDC059095]|uniref:hypothetical protein n=1 Tax=Streptomyces sp. NPDC059095 TaxID=3346726 RepID=UPI0036858BB4